MKIKLALVIPCFNEQDALSKTIPTMVNFLEATVLKYLLDENSYILLVDDGSVDNTWNLIQNSSIDYPKHIKGIRLANNVGHQNALMCGLEYVTNRCTVAISIDADLQNELAAIHKMLDQYKKGYEVVLGVRNSRDGDSYLKKVTATYFYKLLQFFGVNTIPNHADFRLLSNKTLNNLMKFTEVNLFLRGISPLLHNKITTVEYTCMERVAGKSKYSIKKMFSLALNGITSFSTMPLHFISLLGIVVFSSSLCMTFYILYSWVIGNALPGWASIVLPIYILGGLMLLSIGILGEYIGKIFLESKARPRYIIEEVTVNTK